MSARSFRHRRPSRPTYRAQFSGMVLQVLGVRQVLKCQPVIELRPLSERSDLYGIFDMKTGSRLSKSGHSLRDAKVVAAAFYAQQLTEWEAVSTC